MTSQQLAETQTKIENLLQMMELEAHVTLEAEADVVRVQIDGQDLGILIGYHGETLSALQTVVGLMINRDADESELNGRHKVIVNIGDYRQRQRESLEALARRSAERVRFTRKPLTLPTMSSYDRRIVHLALEHEPDVVSESEGEGRDRRMVIRLRQD